MRCATLGFEMKPLWCKQAESAMLRVPCPNCRKLLQVVDTSLDLDSQCPACGTVFRPQNPYWRPTQIMASCANRSPVPDGSRGVTSDSLAIERLVTTPLQEEAREAAR